jgi:hypothetical protein
MGVARYQLVGLVRAVDLAVEHAEREPANHSYQIHVLLAAYAALEALVLETSIDRAPFLYAKYREFRRQGLSEKWRLYLDATNRKGDLVPDEVKRISAYRIAITHSEPDNARILAVTEAFLSGEVPQLARGIRKLAKWLWGDTVPRPAQELFP